MKQKKRVAVVGYGQFGRFMAKHLRSYCTIVPIKRDTDPTKVSTCDVVIFAVPWSSLESVVMHLKPYITPNTLIVDVMSIKQPPLKVLKRHFRHYEILGTHPIFGPQSGKYGLKDLPIVLCNVSTKPRQYATIKRFLKQELELRVIEQTPKQHDQDMAEVQGLTHFIGRAITQMQIKSHVNNTKSYEQLLELIELVGQDTWELFTTIQTTNPEAKKVRAKFLKELQKLETALGK